jgi:DNA helicase-2/ATP-dependent DNA helicase PcrA
MCVGDDKQAIYGWRGSSPCFINNFTEHFPDTQHMLPLSMIENYRSSEKILSSAGSFLSGLPLCKTKDYKAVGESRRAEDDGRN